MTWYRFGREIGDDNDLACYMLDGMAGANDDPDGPVWARRFMEYINDSFTAYDILVEVTKLKLSLTDYVVDWIIVMASYDPYFGEYYGFDWKDDEEEQEGDE